MPFIDRLIEPRNQIPQERKTFSNSFLKQLILPLYDISAETRGLLIIIVIIHNVFCGSIGALFGPFSAGLRAAGDVKFTMYASIFCTVIFRTCLSIVLGVWLQMGVIGVAIAMVSDWALKATLLVLRYRSGKWKQFKLI